MDNCLQVGVFYLPLQNNIRFQSITNDISTLINNTGQNQH